MGTILNYFFASIKSYNFIASYYSFGQIQFFNIGKNFQVLEFGGIRIYVIIILFLQKYLTRYLIS